MLLVSSCATVGGGSFCRLYTPVPYNEAAVNAMSDEAAIPAATNEKLFDKLCKA